MDHQSIIEQIGKSKSLAELDKIAVDYFHNVEKGAVDFDHNIEIAIQAKETELYKKEIYFHHMSNQKTTKLDNIKDNTVPFDLAKKKTALGDTVPNIVSLKNVKCNCRSAYGVPCIHKATFPGIVPDNYEYCPDCGCDHDRDARLAREVHESLGHPLETKYDY